MIQAAHFDIKTVTGLRQALVLSAEYENEPFPLQDYTLHGSIGTYPRQDLKCSVDENGRARIEWDSVPPGNWKYDVFLVSSGNDETPLMEGTFTALPRITPVLDDEAVNDEVGGVLHLPSGNEGVITLEVDGGFVSKEYAAIAKDAADRAEQALKDIKQALQGVVTSLGGESGDILLDSGLKITKNAKENSVSLSLDDKTVVLTAGSQTIDGVKTFSAAPVIAAAPVADNEAANKKYVDNVARNTMDTTINGVSGAITLNLPLNMDADSKVLSVDLSNYASLQTDNTFTGSNTFFAGINGYVDSVNSTGILYTTNAPSDSSTGFPVLSIAHVGSSNVQVSAGSHLMLKSRGGNIYAQSIFIADNNIQVRGSALFNSGVTLSQSLTVGGPAQFNDIVRVETGKIDPGKFGSTWTFGSLIETPTTADNNNHRLACKTTNDNAGYILYHERVINGVWKKDKIILACQFDFTWHNDASILVKTPTEAKQAANKSYVDSQFNYLPLSYVTLDTDQTINGQKNFTGNITVNSSGNNGTLTLYTSGGTGYLSMDTGEMVIPTDLLTITGQTNIQTLNVAESALFTGGVTISQHLSANTIRSSTLETVGIDLRGSDDLDCISLTAFYDSPDEVELIIRPNHLSTDTNDYDVRLHLTCSSRGSYVDWLVGALIQAMRFHPAVEFYNSVKVTGAVLFLGSTTINALLKASQIETDSLEIKDEAYPEGFLCYCDTGGLSMTRPSISESLWDADNPKAILNRSDNDQRYLQVKSLTAAEYEALGSYDPATMYRITDLEPAVVYLGTLKLSLAT